MDRDELTNEKGNKNVRRIGRIITSILFSILILVVIFEAAIGIINMQRINDEKEPVWYLSTEKKDNDLKNETIYNLGLYKIIRTETSKKITVTLRPFFIGD